MDTWICQGLTEWKDISIKKKKNKKVFMFKPTPVV